MTFAIAIAYLRSIVAMRMLDEMACVSRSEDRSDRYVVGIVYWCRGENHH